MGRLKPLTVGQIIEALEQFDRDLPVIYATDEEGNGFDYSLYEPSLGKFDGHHFIPHPENLPDEKDEEYEKSKGTVVVCLN